MTSNLSLSDIAEKLSKFPRILVVSHLNPDADAYGSSCGLTLALKHLGKDALCLNESGILNLKSLSFIPGVKDVLSVSSKVPWDALVFCDCAEITRVGEKLLPSLLSIENTFNIDHHATNTNFAKYNCVVSTASSTCEVIFDLLTEMGGMTPDVATCLYAGVSGDTGSFRYNSTTAKVFGVAKSLVEAGADPGYVGRSLYGSTTLSSVKLEVEALSGLKLHAEGKIVEILITEEMYKRANSSADEADSLVERARDIEGVLVSILIRWDAGIWRVSLRAKDSQINVATIASMFGGGGHMAAAAFRSKKPLEEFRTKVIAEIEKAVKDVTPKEG